MIWRRGGEDEGMRVRCVEWINSAGGFAVSVLKRDAEWSEKEVDVPESELLRAIKLN